MNLHTRIDRAMHFTTFPRTEAPMPFVAEVMSIFKRHTESIGTVALKKGLTSDSVMAVLRADLQLIGFDIELNKNSSGKLKRPVFFGQDGQPFRQYEIDGYHAEWQCGIEIEASRAWMGNAIYRDLIQAMVMVELRNLILAVPMKYKYQSNGKPAVSKDYENTVSVADTLYAHTRIKMPYRLAVIGY